MHHFQIIPTDQATKPIDFIGFDAAGVLQAVQHLSCTGARVLRDGSYCFDVRLDDSGVWHVSQNSKPSPPRLVPKTVPVPTAPAIPPVPPLI